MWTVGRTTTAGGKKEEKNVILCNNGWNGSDLKFSSAWLKQWEVQQQPGRGEGEADWRSDTDR